MGHRAGAGPGEPGERPMPNDHGVTRSRRARHPGEQRRLERAPFTCVQSS